MMKACNILFVLLFALFSVVLAMPRDTTVPKKHICGCNEFWSNCDPPPVTGCDQNCHDRCFPGGCGSCTPKCRCVSGYIRINATGPCIRECECPPCRTRG